MICKINMRIFQSFFVLFLGVVFILPKYLNGQDVHSQLDSIYNWFQNNPPDSNGSNFQARWDHTKLIDEYGLELSVDSWRSYRNANSSILTKLINNHPILYYLNKAETNAFDQIRNTVVTKGLVIWKLYNMGYILKTKDVCFTIDLVQHGSADLIDLFDFSVVSHVHSDHVDMEFLKAMLAAGKEVYAPFEISRQVPPYEKATLISSTSEFTFGEVNVRFTMNKQTEDVPVIISQIDCGSSTNHYTIYHIGDARILEDLNPTKLINLLILHISNGINIFSTVARVNPEATVYDHIMELGHATGQYRWSYDFTYNKMKSQPHTSSYVLTWGEKIDKRNITTNVPNYEKYSSLNNKFNIYQNYPNPFNPTTNISFTLPKAEYVTLEVYNSIGKKVARMLDSKIKAGSHDMRFDASALPSGIYFYRLQAGGFSQVRKMVLLR